MQAAFALICGFLMTSSLASMKTEWEETCKNDEEYSNVDLIGDWANNVTGYAMADSFLCFKQYFKISMSADILEFSLPRNGDSVGAQFERTGNHYESIGMTPSKLYFFNDSESPDQLYVLECGQGNLIIWYVVINDANANCTDKCAEDVENVGFSHNLRSCITGVQFK